MKWKTLFLLPTLLLANWSADSNTFGFSLGKTLEGANSLFSPYSIRTALLMPYLGATGVTEEEMGKTLCIGDEVMPPLIASSCLQLATSAWVDSRIALAPEYSEVLKESFHSTLNEISFLLPEKAALEMNQWVSNNTEGLIPSFIDHHSLSPTTRLMLISTLYFKESWSFPFSIRQTTKRPFYGLEGIHDVPMMQQEHRFPYFESEKVSAISIPFGTEGRFSLIIALPKDGHALEMETIPLVKWEHKFVDLQLPRFKLQKKYDLIPTLEKLGMHTAFSSSADFSGITGNKDLKIDKVFTETILDVNEFGASAAAATGVQMGLTAFLAVEHIPFIANRPFGVMLVDNNSDLILVVGEICTL